MTDTAAKKDPDTKPVPPDEPQGPEPTHDLLLSNGTTVQSSGAVPTHYHDGESGLLLRVLHAAERKLA